MSEERKYLGRGPRLRKREGRADRPAPKAGSEEKQDEFRVLAERRGEKRAIYAGSLVAAKLRAGEFIGTGVTQPDPWDRVRIQQRPDADSPWEDVADE